jgi:hypothetical protein
MKKDLSSACNSFHTNNKVGNHKYTKSDTQKFTLNLQTMNTP